MQSRADEGGAMVRDDSFDDLFDVEWVSDEDLPQMDLRLNCLDLREADRLP
jgi:hypothetical protein